MNRSQRARQVLKVVHDEIVLEGEGIEIPLDDDAAVAALVLHKFGLLEVQHAVALLVARIVHDDEDNHDSLLHGLAEQPADGLVLRRRGQAVGQDQGELPQVLGAAGRILHARGAEVVDGPAHQQRDVGAVLLEIEVLQDLGPRVVGGERFGEVMRHKGVCAEAEDADLADLEHRQRARDHDEGLEGERAGARLAHAARVVDAEEDLVAALRGDGAAHPDLVALVAGGDVGDDLLDVEALTRAVGARELCRLRGSKDEAKLGGEGKGERRFGEVAEGQLLVADVRCGELRGGFLNDLLFVRFLFGSLDLVLRGRYLAVKSALACLDTRPAIVFVGASVLLLDFRGLRGVHLVGVLVHLHILGVRHHAALGVFFLFVNGHRFVDRLHLVFRGVAHGLGIGRGLVVLEMLELASAELRIDVLRLLLLALFLLLLGVLDVVLLTVPTLEGIAELLEGILPAVLRHIVLVLVGGLRLVVGPRKLALLPGAGLLLRGSISCVSILPLSSVGVEVVLNVHLLGVLVLAATLDIARRGVCVGVGVIPRGFHAVVRLLGLIGLLFLLCLRLHVDLGFARKIFFRRLLLFLLPIFFGALVVGSLRFILPVLYVGLLLLHRQGVILLHVLILLDLIVLKLRFFLLRAGLFLLHFLISLVDLLLIIFCLVVFGVGVSIGGHLLILLLPLGLVALLVFLCLLVVSVPHLFVNCRGVKVIDIADLFVHFVLILAIFALSVRVLFLVVSTTHTTHLSLKLLVRHVNRVLLVFHLAVLFFVWLLSKFRQVLVRLDIFADILRSITVSQTGSGL
ncbi:uncharacterised protein [Colletotrichum tofieldiae]|nr:uncharacterised protein [Colletotrichum tofieldiae]GKT88107.1 uncharacterised protein [Colletotrichum tofieldiae]